MYNDALVVYYDRVYCWYYHNSVVVVWHAFLNFIFVFLVLLSRRVGGGEGGRAGGEIREIQGGEGGNLGI